MDTFLIKAAQLILAFAILVIIHEFGHFLFARIFGIKVEKFYIFFDPWIEIFKWKPKKYFGGLGKTKSLEKDLPASDAPEIPELELPQDATYTEVKPSRKKRKNSFWGDTEYGIGWLPLGGYCKIAGMIDESMDKEQMKQPPKEWEFRSKPAWQRLLVMIAGVLFNFLLAILIYAGILYTTGERYVPFSEAENGMVFSPEAQKAGFRDGDIPLSADGELLENPGDAVMKIINAKDVTVLRGKDTVTINIPEKFIFRLDEEDKAGNTPISFMAYAIPAKVKQVVNGGGAAKSGIREGDEIVTVAGVLTPDVYKFLDEMKNHSDKVVPLKVVRNQKDTLDIAVQLDSSSKMGIGLETDPTAIYKYVTREYGLFESVPAGIKMGTERLSSYASSLKLIFTKEGAQSIGGFGAIGSIFPESWDWIAFWNIAAFLSVALAVMNILPIPALDGGHVLFLLYEVVTRRKPSEKFMEWAQMIGMGLLILLLVYANGMDIIRLFK